MTKLSGAGVFSGRGRFLVGGLLIVAAIVYLIASSTQAAAQYYLTIDELASKGASAHGRNLRISGAVDGQTIDYDARSMTLRFVLANVPADLDQIEREGGLAEVLHRAVIDPNVPRVQVVYVGPRPDLLRNEAQAVVTGRMGEDGVFYADDLLLKCPTRYEEEIPAQVTGG